MPSLGADMEFGTLVEWRVKPGDTVHRGDVVAEVETEKGVVEVEIFEQGVVEEIAVERGRKVPVGAVLARIRADGEAAPAALAPAPPPVTPVGAPPAAEAPAPRLAPAPTPTPGPRGDVVRASPAARALAAQHELQLATIAGSGPGGAVTLGDVERALRAASLAVPSPVTPEPRRVSPLAARIAADLRVDLATVVGTGEAGTVTRADVERVAAAHPAASPPPTPLEPAPPSPGAPGPEGDRHAAMRRAIAAVMTRAWHEIPHYHLVTDIDLSRATRWLAAENLQRPVTERLLPAVLMLKAVALALREVPALNGFWIDGAFRAGAAIHVGIAISLRGGGLIAPAIHDADTMTLDALMRALREVVQRARSGMLRSSELTDPTITVTNLGDQGVRGVFGVIYPPQVALVGIGKVSERPWAEGGMVGARPAVTMTLAADHRASDGHGGALFLAAVDRLLQAPDRL